MKLKSIELEHTNPSMGPHERVRTITLRNEAPHQAEIERFLTDTKLFDKVVLRAYLEAASRQDAAVLRMVTDEVRAVDTSTLNQGATISNLHVAFDDGQVISLDDLRYYHFTGYGRAFFPYMVQHGSIVDSERASGIGAQLKSVETEDDRFDDDVAPTIIEFDRTHD